MLPEKPKIAIIGAGHVGRAMLSLFPEATLYDKYIGAYAMNRELANDADIALVCVPTPASQDGSADLNAIEEVFGWLRTPWVIIRSTVPPGTTERLRERLDRPVVFWPEYFGEWTHAIPWEHSVKGWPFVLLGGRPEDTRPIVPWLAGVFGANRIYRQSNARTAELCKYMENTWLASQVLFANEFLRISSAIEVDYWELRELWALDPRVSKHHTAAFEQSPGFGGNCLHKDISALIASSSRAGYEPSLLQSYLNYNHTIKTL